MTYVIFAGNNTPLSDGDDRAFPALRVFHDLVEELPSPLVFYLAYRTFIRGKKNKNFFLWIIQH